jgi:hypothetical protein
VLLSKELVEVKQMSVERHRWAEPYRLAVLETNGAKLTSRIFDARSAISKRIIELENDTANMQERQALTDALKFLALLTQQEARDQEHGSGKLLSS